MYFYRTITLLQLKQNYCVTVITVLLKFISFLVKKLQFNYRRITLNQLGITNMFPVSSDVIPCTLVEVYRRFRGYYRFNYSTPMIEAAGSSEKSIHLQYTQRHIPEDSNHHPSPVDRNQTSFT